MNSDSDGIISKLEREIKELDARKNACIRAQHYLEEYDKAQEKISTIPAKREKRELLKNYTERLKKATSSSIQDMDEEVTTLKEKTKELNDRNEKISKGIKLLEDLALELPEKELQTDYYLEDLIKEYLQMKSSYGGSKVDLKVIIDKFKELEEYPLIDISLKLSTLTENEFVSEATEIMESLDEIKDFKLNKYESQKQLSKTAFRHFLTGTLPQKIANFGNLEGEFKREVSKVNRNLALAQFDVIKDIRIEVDENKQHHSSMASLFTKLQKEIVDSTNMYGKESLFYMDKPRSIKNIQTIKDLLGEIKKKGTEGTINMFDSIDLSISFIENGKKNKNRKEIKNDSSSGGNILLKVAIAISILNIYYKPEDGKTPFYLIIDEVSKLQFKNRNLLRDYINTHGFKTLFITPDDAYPDPEKTNYYIFNNIANNEDSLEVTQLNFA